MALHYSSNSKPQSGPSGITEFEILKSRHKFLREDGEEALTWDDKLARKYYENLYREFAVCDLKHYKSGAFSLRWRTEEEVLEGTGETTCGNPRCGFHLVRSAYGAADPQSLTTLELPFAYTEQGENKSALVKVVLCPGCVKKIMWKRTKEKEVSLKESLGINCEKDFVEGAERTAKRKDGPECSEDHPGSQSRRSGDVSGKDRRRREDKDDKMYISRSRQRRSSRSRSPYRQNRDKSSGISTWI